ncbi:MAG: glycoside hydrolase [Planctomycetaceae bacterium]|nr:glycoside hydrolase [Planctomycetaceae bacterium]
MWGSQHACRSHRSKQIGPQIGARIGWAAARAVAHLFSLSPDYLMTDNRHAIWLLLIVCAAAWPAQAQQRSAAEDAVESIPLADVRLRDVCILPDAAMQTYYMVGPGRNSVRIFTSRDLKTWQGPQTIFRTPEDIWGEIPVVGIWAPEMHKYRDKYYLFLTFDTRHLLDEQWPNWRPRVRRSSQILVGDAPTGPFTPFANHSTLPPELMTLDATLWVEDGKPYVVYCHEWVQISNGTIEYLGLTDDLSKTIGEPQLMFRGSDGPWAQISATEGCFVTDGPYLRLSKSGKLFMVWSGFGNGGYTVGLAISDSGKLAGPWRQQAEPLYQRDGGHAMLFETFDGRVMMVLHSPNNREARPRIFELEDTGETLKVVGEFTGE